MCVPVKVTKPEGTEQGGVSLDVRPEKDNAYFWSKKVILNSAYFLYLNATLCLFYVFDL